MLAFLSGLLNCFSNFSFNDILTLPHFMQFYHLPFLHAVVELGTRRHNSYLHDYGYSLMEILRIR